MPRRQTNRRPREIEEELSPEEWELVDFIEEVGGTISRVYIWRIPKHGENEYLDRVSVDVLKDGAEDYLRDTFGAPSKYLLRFKGADGRWKLAKIINIGSLDKNAYMASLTNGTSTGSPIGSASQREKELDKELALMQTRSHEMLMGLIANLGKDKGVDLGSLMAGIGTTITSLMTAVKTGAGDNGGGTKIKEIRELIGVVQDVKGLSAPTEENMYTMLKDVGNKVVETFGGAGRPAAAPAALPPPGQVITIPTDGAAAPAGVVAAADPAPGAPRSLQDWVRLQLDYLKKKALADKEAEDWIDYILDNEEEPGCAAIMYALRQKVTFEQLLQFDAEIGQNPKLLNWFKILYDGLLHEINAPVDTAGAPGNDGNPSGHGETSTPGGPQPVNAGASGAAR